ncbi:MAG: hypothetical protein GY893_11215 [bacterium]|nr:hypothetical protein [bacterium]
MSKTVSVEWACVFLSAVARFHVLVGVAVVVAVCCADGGIGCVGVGVAVVAVVVARLL